MADGGLIVNITDIAAEKPFAGYPAYCAAKAALQALTKSAAKALAGRNIRVNAVAPGAILWEEDRGAEDTQHVLRQIPMKRAGAPQDIANAVLYFVGNDYVTAQTLRVDGGWHTG
jgi:pteridine reductase